MSVVLTPNDASSTVPTHPASSHGDRHEEKHKHIGNYEILKTVGEGSFAKVKLAIHRLTKQKVALKIIDKEKLPDEYSLKNIHREAQIMRLLDHQNVIQLYEVMETKKELFLVLEFAVGGELLDYIVARGRLHEKEARKFFGQVTSALEYCHALNIAENLLLDENCNIKITDFGLSNVFDRSKNLVTCCGSPVYSAPELIEGKKYTGPEVDCWSLGINLYAMVVGDLPFADSNLTALYNSILKGVYHVPDFVSAECKDLIAKLLERNPEKRWTIVQARDHVWVTHGLLLDTSSNNVVKTRPKTESELDLDLIEQIQSMGFERQAAVASILGGKFNQAAGTYYLMAAQKRNEEEKKAKALREQLKHEAVLAKPATGSSRSPTLAGAATFPSKQGRSDLDTLRAQIESERQKTKPGETNPALNDIILEYERRKAELQEAKNSSSKPNLNSVTSPNRGTRGVAGVGGNPPDIIFAKSTSAQPHQQHHVLPASIIGPGLVPLANNKANSKSVEIGNALMQQQAAYLVPNSPPNSHNAVAARDSAEKAGNVLQTGPLTDLLYAAHAAEQYKGKSGLAAPVVASADASSNNSLGKNGPAGGATGGGGRRQREHSVKYAIPIDAALYLDPTLDEDAARDPAFPEIRTIRFAFNCQTTTSLPPDIMMERLKKVLDRNDVTWRFEGFLAECEWGDIKFEVEICKLPRMKTYGLRLKRNAGDMWDYKRLSGKISSELEL